MSRPGVIVKTRFIDKQAEIEKGRSHGKNIQTFKGYIDYIDRNEAIRNDNFSKILNSQLAQDFAKYNIYMENPEKSTGLFTAEKDRLTKEENRDLKKLFQSAYDNDSIMWQTVISFDNSFLAELGIYDPATRILNEARLQECTRNMMKQMLKHESMEHSAVWSASIHYNTDNIHIHVATVEPTSTRQKVNVNGQERPRGQIKRKTLSAMKSQVVNTLLQRDRSYMDELVRKRMVAGKNQHNSLDDEKFRDMFLNIYHSLPPDRRQWYYNMSALNGVRSKIDDMTREFINTYYKEDFKEFRKQLLHEEQVMRRVYGEKSQYQNYTQTKIKDLYSRMGNSILKEMREYAKSEIQPHRSAQRHPKRNNYTAAQYTHQNQHLGSTILRLLGRLREDYEQKYLNERAHEQLNDDLQMQ